MKIFLFWKKVKFFFYEKFFSNFFLRNVFCTKIISYKFFFFGENFNYRIFFGENFFSQKYFCEDFFHNIFAHFFCIWCLRNNVFCGIFYSKFCLLRFFLFCNFGVGKKNYTFFFRFFFSAMNVNNKFENFSLLKKSKIFSDRTFGFLYSLLGK